MLVKSFIILMILAILFSLGSGLYYLVKDKSDKNRLVKALTWRIGISITLFILLFIGFASGVIHPHGLQ